MSTRTLLITLPVIVSAACAAKPSPPAGATPVPDALIPVGETRSGVFAARGVQIYECRAKQGAPDGAEWAFVAPEATLLDEQGNVAGKHYAGPHWEAGDGSKIVGTVRASAAAPRADSIPWLLLDARSVGGAGRLAKVTSVQRINTAGGKAPSTGCTASALGQTVRVPYTADYAMFAR